MGNKLSSTMSSSPTPALLEQTKKQYGAVSIQERPGTAPNVVDEVLTKIGCGTFQFIAFFLAALTVIAFYAQASSYAFLDLQLGSQWNLSDLKYAVLFSTTGAANVIGGIGYSYLADSYGRVWPYAISMFLIGAFVLASAFSPSFPVLVVLRGMGAISVGGILGLVYPMLMEFLPISRRGQTGVLVMATQSLGGCITAGLAWWLIPTYPVNGWRYLVIATAILSFAAFAFRLFFYVESPRFQVTKHKPEAAWKTFSLMASMNCHSLSDLVEKQDFMLHFKHDRMGPKTSIELLKSFLMIFSRQYVFHTIPLLFTHMTAVTSYVGMTLFLPDLLKSLNVNPYSVTLIGNVAQIPGVLLMSIIIEWPWFGRLNSLRLFFALSVIFFFLFAFIQNSITIPVFTVFLYFSLSPTLGLLQTYTSECYPTEIRAMALAFFDVFNAVCNIFVPFCGGYLADLTPTYPWISSVVWGSVVVVGLVFSLLLWRETRGKNLNESFQ